MIKSVHFKNFKALIDATLPLNSFTLIVGPNGSGKSTAMQGLHVAGEPGQFSFRDVVTASLKDASDITVEIEIGWDVNDTVVFSKSGWKLANRSLSRFVTEFDVNQLPDNVITNLRRALNSFQIYSFDAQKLAAPAEVITDVALSPDGSNLAGVLDDLQDREPERFVALNEELGRWLPEFDRVLFDKPKTGHKSLSLRTRSGHRIKATDLSHGTLFALAFLTLAYLPNPPAILCFEEPERGIHPRLLREVRDAMYRLCYPEDYGEKRSPVQVIATTHSPYFLDLYKDHPEEVVIAHKDESGVHFERLSDKPNLDEFLQDAPLGEVWYSGILGGVPSQP